MSWNVALIVDPKYDPHAIGSLESEMPIWIVDTPSNRAFAEKLWKASEEIWLPQPICTIFKSVATETREQNCIDLLHTLDGHHPRLAKLQIIGISDSEKLRHELARLNFLPFDANQTRPIYVRPIDSMTNVPHFSLDATDWKNYDDVYDALLKALGSPAGHGRNFNALDDSIAGGYVNAVEVPYYLSILNLKSTTAEVQSFVNELVDLIFYIQSTGCPISIRIDD